MLNLDPTTLWMNVNVESNAAMTTMVDDDDNEVGKNLIYDTKPEFFLFLVIASTWATFLDNIN